MVVEHISDVTVRVRADIEEAKRKLLELEEITKNIRPDIVANVNINRDALNRQLSDLEPQEAPTIDITYCSAKKAPTPQPPERLYQSSRIDKFFQMRPQGRIFSDQYGIMEPGRNYAPYEKPPWNVTPQEFNELTKQSFEKVRGRNVNFWVDPNTFHELYQRLIRQWQNLGTPVRTTDVDKAYSQRPILEARKAFTRVMGSLRPDTLARARPPSIRDLEILGQIGPGAPEPKRVQPGTEKPVGGATYTKGEIEFTDKGRVIPPSDREARAWDARRKESIVEKTEEVSERGKGIEVWLDTFKHVTVNIDALSTAIDRAIKKHGDKVVTAEIDGRKVVGKLSSVKEKLQLLNKFETRTSHRLKVSRESFLKDVKEIEKESDDVKKKEKESEDVEEEEEEKDIAFVTDWEKKIGPFIRGKYARHRRHISGTNVLDFTGISRGEVGTAVHGRDLPQDLAEDLSFIEEKFETPIWLMKDVDKVIRKARAYYIKQKELLQGKPAETTAMLTEASRVFEILQALRRSGQFEDSGITGQERARPNPFFAVPAPAEAILIELGKSLTGARPGEIAKTPSPISRSHQRITDYLSDLLSKSQLVTRQISVVPTAPYVEGFGPTASVDIALANAVQKPFRLTDKGKKFYDMMGLKTPGYGQEELPADFFEGLDLPLHTAPKVIHPGPKGRGRHRIGEHKKKYIIWEESFIEETEELKERLNMMAEDIVKVRGGESPKYFSESFIQSIADAVPILTTKEGRHIADIKKMRFSHAAGTFWDILNARISRIHNVGYEQKMEWELWKEKVPKRETYAAGPMGVETYVKDMYDMYTRPRLMKNIPDKGVALAHLENLKNLIETDEKSKQQYGDEYAGLKEAELQKLMEVFQKLMVLSIPSITGKGLLETPSLVDVLNERKALDRVIGGGDITAKASAFMNIITEQWRRIDKQLEIGPDTLINLMRVFDASYNLGKLKPEPMRDRITGVNVNVGKFIKEDLKRRLEERRKVEEEEWEMEEHKEGEKFEFDPLPTIQQYVRDVIRDLPMKFRGALKEVNISSFNKSLRETVKAPSELFGGVEKDKYAPPESFPWEMMAPALPNELTNIHKLWDRLSKTPPMTEKWKRLNELLIRRSRILETNAQALFPVLWKFVEGLGPGVLLRDVSFEEVRKRYGKIKYLNKMTGLPATRTLTNREVLDRLEREWNGLSADIQAAYKFDFLKELLRGEIEGIPASWKRQLNYLMKGTRGPSPEGVKNEAEELAREAEAQADEVFSNISEYVEEMVHTSESDELGGVGEPKVVPLETPEEVDARNAINKLVEKESQRVEIRSAHKPLPYLGRLAIAQAKIERAREFGNALDTAGKSWRREKPTQEAKVPTTPEKLPKLPAMPSVASTTEVLAKQGVDEKVVKKLRRKGMGLYGGIPFPSGLPGFKGIGGPGYDLPAVLSKIGDKIKQLFMGKKEEKKEGVAEEELPEVPEGYVRLAHVTDLGHHDTESSISEQGILYRGTLDSTTSEMGRRGQWKEKAREQYAGKQTMGYPAYYDWGDDILFFDVTQDTYKQEFRRSDLSELPSGRLKASGPGSYVGRTTRHHLRQNKFTNLKGSPIKGNQLGDLPPRVEGPLPEQAPLPAALGRMASALTGALGIGKAKPKTEGRIPQPIQRELPTPEPEEESINWGEVYGEAPPAAPTTTGGKEGGFGSIHILATATDGRPLDGSDAYVAGFGYFEGTPTTARNIPVGSRTVVTRRSGYADGTTVVTVRPNETVPATTVMRRAQAGEEYAPPPKDLMGGQEKADHARRRAEAKQAAAPAKAGTPQAGTPPSTGPWVAPEPPKPKGLARLTSIPGRVGRRFAADVKGIVPPEKIQVVEAAQDLSYRGRTPEEVEKIKEQIVAAHPELEVSASHYQARATTETGGPGGIEQGSVIRIRLSVPKDQMTEKKRTEIVDWLRQVADSSKAATPALIQFSEKTVTNTKHASHSLLELVGQGGKIGRLSWTFASLAMSSMGVFFSLSSILRVLQQGIGYLFNPLKDLEGVLGSIGWLMARGFGDEVQGWMDAMGVNQQDIVDGWMKMKDIMSLVIAGFGIIGAALMKTGVYDTIINIVKGFIEWAMQPEVQNAVKSIFTSILDAMPVILSTLTIALKIIEKLVAPYAGWLLFAAIITMLLQPVWSLLSMFLNLGKIVVVAYLAIVKLAQGFWWLASVANGAITSIATSLVSMGTISGAALSASLLVGLTIGLIAVWAMIKLGWMKTISEWGAEWRKGGESMVKDLQKILLGPISMLGTVINDVLSGSFKKLKSDLGYVLVQIVAALERVIARIQYYAEWAAAVGNKDKQEAAKKKYDDRMMAIRNTEVAAAIATGNYEGEEGTKGGKKTVKVTGGGYTDRYGNAIIVTGGGAGGAGGTATSTVGPGVTELGAGNWTVTPGMEDILPPTGEGITLPEVEPLEGGGIDKLFKWGAIGAGAYTIGKIVTSYQEYQNKANMAANIADIKKLLSGNQLEPVQPGAWQADVAGPATGKASFWTRVSNYFRNIRGGGRGGLPPTTGYMSTGAMLVTAPPKYEEWKAANPEPTGMQRLQLAISSALGIPMMQEGGKVGQTGVAVVHKDEMVLPANVTKMFQAAMVASGKPNITPLVPLKDDKALKDISTKQDETTKSVDKVQGVDSAILNKTTNVVTNTSAIAQEVRRLNSTMALAVQSGFGGSGFGVGGNVTPTGTNIRPIAPATQTAKPPVSTVGVSTVGTGTKIGPGQGPTGNNLTDYSPGGGGWTVPSPVNVPGMDRPQAYVPGEAGAPSVGYNNMNPYTPSAQQTGTWKNYGSGKWYWVDYSGTTYGPYTEAEYNAYGGKAPTRAPAGSGQAPPVAGGTGYNPDVQWEFGNMEVSGMDEYKSYASQIGAGISPAGGSPTLMVDGTLVEAYGEGSILSKESQAAMREAAASQAKATEYTNVSNVDYNAAMSNMGSLDEIRVKYGTGSQQYQDAYFKTYGTYPPTGTETAAPGPAYTTINDTNPWYPRGSGTKYISTKDPNIWIMQDPYSGKYVTSSGRTGMVSTTEFKNVLNMMFPSAQVGGLVTRGGLLNVHGAELIAPLEKVLPSVSRDRGMGSDNSRRETNITNNFTIQIMGNPDRRVTDEMIDQIRRDIMGVGFGH